jgi:hypothetical protein
MRFIVSLLFLIGSPFMSANDLNTEIQYLKNFIQDSNCQFVRNGDKHTTQEALEHIQKKQDYFEDDIHTAEDFIRLSASKSTFSGNPYTVICPSSKGQQTITSQTWLLRALEEYRNQEN